MDLIDIAKRFGTPLYVYDGDMIRKRYRELKAAFSSDIRVYYAMKANYNPAILKILFDEGASIDAVSPGDVLLALKVGFPPERILFTANKITDKEMELVHDNGILFNIGSLSRLKRYAKHYPGDRICIRFNPSVEAGENELVRTGGESSKFGIALDDVDRVTQIVTEHKLVVVGIHEHTGSGIPETVKMLEGMDQLLSLAKPDYFPALEFVDFGGGFKVPYKPDEERIDYRKFGESTIERCNKVSSLYGRTLTICFEPGKYIVSEAGQLIVRVTTLKAAGSKSFAGTNSGFPQLIRPVFYQAYHHIENLTNPDGEKRAYDVVGNICESGDCFAVDRELPEIREGDLLSIRNAGAYCYSMGGVYNLRPMPAEVLVEDGEARLVRKRQSFEELADSIIKESAV